MAGVLTHAILFRVMYVCCVALSSLSSTANTPSVTANAPSVTTNTPLMTTKALSMTANAPSLTAIAPSVTVNKPPVTAHTHAMAVSSPSMTDIASTVTENTPLVNVNTPLITANSPSITDIAPPLTTNTPYVIANTRSMIANEPSVTVNTALVTSHTPSSTADTTIWTPQHYHGLKTHVEGDRIIYEMNKDFLANCPTSKVYEGVQQRIKNGTVVINNDSTSHFMKGTLKISFGQDNVTRAPDTDNIKRKCMIRHAYSDKWRWNDYGTEIKVPEFDLSPVDDFGILLFPTKNKEFGFEKSEERPRVFYYLWSPWLLEIHWIHLPTSLRMEMNYNFLVKQKEARTVKTWTSTLTGFVRTPYWDGFSAMGGNILSQIFYRRSQIEHIVVPDGHRSMFSWEDIGIGDMMDCRVLWVGLVNMNKPTGKHYRFCSTATPRPVLLAWKQVGFATYSDKYQDLFKSVFTGFSIRFSLHPENVLPIQLTNTMWDCSAANWQDFKQHLRCNLIIECFGGEDEADCSYTDGTCRHGYLAAGGSCFTFDLTPAGVMTSWNEAEAACRGRGARLPTLNTPAKWQAVLDLLSHRGWANIYIGLSSSDPNLPDQYKYHLQWSDSSVAYYIKADFLFESHCGTCAFLKANRRTDFLYMDICNKRVPGSLLCEEESSIDLRAIAFPTENNPPLRINSTRCPKGHVTHNFLSCDSLTDCFANCHTTLSGPPTLHPPMFDCHDEVQRVPFTLVCDHRQDCSDSSDEICVFPRCREYECKSKQCISHNKTCDGVKDCLDGSDEFSCGSIFLVSHSFVNSSKPLPAMVLHDGKGSYDLLDIANPSSQTTSSDARSTVKGCPDSHFQCPAVSYYCMPVYVRCNGVNDCPGHEDEADCDNFECPAFFRCRNSKICLHGDYLCDGIFQCPQRDDELMCGFVCPTGCTCFGLAFYCAVPFDASSHVGLRFLDAIGSGMTLKALSNNTMLSYLNLAKCNISQLATMNFFNVFYLDLSENFITVLALRHMDWCQNLQYLKLAGNPLKTILEDSSSSQGVSFAKLHTLDLFAVPVTSEMIVKLRMFSNVASLNLSSSRLDTMSQFSVFSKLRVLDLRGCPMTHFTRSLFAGLQSLGTVYADNYKLCCPDTLPDGFNVLNCHAPFDEVSSCEGLLKSGLYRVGLSMLTTMALMGNLGSFVYRVFINRPKQQSSFGLFVTNLCVSDFLMGLYSAIIGVADQLYLGNYVWNDVSWKKSVICKIAGVLSMMSNEVSVLVICLITVDRFLVTRFPLSRQLHFSSISARVACVVAWSVGFLLAVSPFLSLTEHWNFYGQTGICTPLPVTRIWFAGREYSFGIMIILNFVLFLVIAGGQMSIYLSIRANSMTTSDTTQKAKDITIARRLITVAVTDFLCWFPVGLLGILSSRGHPIPGEASVVIAVFVMPLNSALNPFLYTINVVLERRQRIREERMMKMVLHRHAQREGERNK